MTIHYPTPAANLPPAAFAWSDNAGNLLDFTSGYTFRLTLSQPPNPSTIVKTSGFTTYTPVAGSPNLSVAWADSELNALTPGRWRLQITATQTSNGGQRVLTGTLTIDELQVA